ncbi:MAG: YcjF family protein [Thalassotalea sp.]
MSIENDNDHAFHQKILFDDAEINPQQADAPLESAIVFNNQDYQDAQQSYLEKEEHLEPDKKPRWLLRIIVGLVISITFIEAILFLLDGFTSSPVITLLYSALFSALCVVGGSVFIKELRGLKQLKKQHITREQASAVLAGDLDVPTLELCQKIHQQLSFDLPEPVEKKWQESMASQLSEQELIQLFDLQVLAKVDEKAIAEIAKYSSETMVLVAISPLALMDMLIMLWRNIRMIDKISGLYGLKLGYWSRIKLIKQVFANMIFVGASEMVIDLGTEAIGADLLGKFSGRMAQGFGAGMLTARLGLNTIKTCRPLPFIEQAPQLSNVRKSLLTQVKILLMPKS